ncbi:lipopolysaccharide assembly protein LapA domain-containing protein [Aquamicrobium zhengzhouense]|uniref:DUF1049 domain-containing protein n=1 Tax=Aquamicrobium zhengzhouense TaxID=2781738 RepID=A0ABS0SGE2_9HYPH|nr:lipopolysaccharide assembly protein LapA domain-containing protein [Aquamicrobium zhengzhouense]MBI1621864.1 DUF1049 domain-containing protein [Aquamicrobium zhengzhouense]
MLNRFITVVILIPLAIVLISLAVANRAPADFTIDPFNPGNPALTITLPLFVLLFLALLTGLVIGGVITWLRQGRYRKLARKRDAELATVQRAAPAPSEVPALPRPNV